jgi:ornithine cyclodeaminase/alanine dehydrogenase-like protein (mu-crystallin family)
MNEFLHPTGMAEVLVLSGANLAALLDLDEPLLALADAFGSLGAGRAPRSHRGSRSGPRAGCSAPCWSTAWGWRSPASWSPSSRVTATAPCWPTRACSRLFGAEDGTPPAVMDGACITAARTGAVAVVAANALACPDARVVCGCTDARQPVIRAAWLAPGAHVSSGAASGPSSTPRRRAPAGSWSSGAARS